MKKDTIEKRRNVFIRISVLLPLTVFVIYLLPEQPNVKKPVKTDAIQKAQKPSMYYVDNDKRTHEGGISRWEPFERSVFEAEEEGFMPVKHAPSGIHDVESGATGGIDT